MGNRSSPVTSRVALAIAGVVVVGGIGAVVAVRPMLPRGFALANPSRSQTNVSPSASATPGATSAPDQSPTPGGTPGTTPTTGPTPTPGPRPTSTPAPTRTPAPTPTPIPTLQGTIGTIGSNSFVLQLGGGSTTTVFVNGSTAYRYNGSPSSWSALTAGWETVVTGTYQADGSFLASRVDSCSGVNCDT